MGFLGSQGNNGKFLPEYPALEGSFSHFHGQIYFIKSILPWSNQSWTYLSLSNSTDPRLESAFLGYLLRRRVLSIETLTLKANDSMIVAVNWLNRIHAQVII